MGSWGTGRPYDPAAAQPAALRWLTGEDWRPALKAVVAPVAVLLLAALIAAVPGDYDLGYRYDSPGYGDRFGTALAMALAALGAPFKLGLTGRVFRGEDGPSILVRTVPMTVTALWLLALWLGLRAGVRLRQARTGEQQTRAQAAGEAVRTALVTAGATLLVGLVGGADWSPSGARGSGFGSYYGDVQYGSDSGWLEAVGWSALLAGLLAFTVYGTDALRWAAWRNRAVRGWAVAGLAAGRAAAVSTGLAALVGFVLIAVQDEGWATGTAVAFLPNIGLTLLGLGSGATLRAGAGAGRYDGYYEDGPGYGSGGPGDEFSVFDLHGETADWRWTLLLALAAAAYLGWTAHRRGLDAADRIRLAVVYAAGLTLLMAVAGFVATSGSGSLSGRKGGADDFSVSLLFGSQLAANVVWAAVGALAVPPLLAAIRGGRAAGRPGAVPAQSGPYDGAVHPGVVQDVGVFVPGQGQGQGPDQGQGQSPGRRQAAGVGEVIGSHEAPPSPGPAAPEAGGEAVDPDVWRKQP
ncbi:hypothetical protein J5Y04_23725 [Kitasatospora sp. RG8]|uniref:hypothetical protein n=1 Tax=Kitasatospora sp. RG8 TaxID=2820815 RepID=UPI001AE0C81E|nr:hypothetical protein [Kitasatospora sp. RG8]MBP0452530.1 hypothetical protein [Kitasatospora sp. RG8]